MTDVQLSSSAVNSNNPMNLHGTQITMNYNRNFDSPIYAGSTVTTSAVSEVNLGARENPAMTIEGSFNPDNTGSSKPTVSKLKDFWKNTTSAYIKDDDFNTSWTEVVVTSVKANSASQDNIINYTIEAIETL